MKTSEDRLKFKNHFGQLGKGRIIPILQASYWRVLWEEPEVAGDIFDLLSSEDVKTVLQQNKYNFILFIRILCLKIVEINRVNKKLVGKLIIHLLNCIRWLTKLLPFLYELEDYSLEIQDNLFWKPGFQIKLTSRIIDNDKSDHIPFLGSSLVTSLIDLLFTSEFTVDPNPSSKIYSKKIVQIWEPGIGTNSKFKPSNLIYESNRSEILRLLLVLCSNSMYQSPSNIVSQGCKFSTFLVTSIPKVEILTLCYSLFNLVGRSSKLSLENGLDLKNNQLLQMKYMYISYSIQLLSYILVYPIPSSENLKFLDEVSGEHRTYNFPRSYFEKFRKPEDLEYIIDSLINIIQQPVINTKSNEDSKFSINRNASQPSLWSTPAIVLLWELIQCNDIVKSLVMRNSIDKLMISLLFNIFTFYKSLNHSIFIKEATYFFLYLSSDDIIEKIFEKVGDCYTNLPNNFKVSPGPITTRDFLVIQLCHFLLDKVSNLNEMFALTLVESLYNLIIINSSSKIYMEDKPNKRLQNANPYGGLSYTAASSITQLVTKFSHKQFLMEKPIHANLLAIVLRSITTAVIKNPKSSRMLLFSILKNEKVYNQVWNNIYSFTTEYFDGNNFHTGIEDLEVKETEPDLSIYNGINSLARFNSNRSFESTISINNVANYRNNSVTSLVPQEEEEHDLHTKLFIEEIEISMRPKPLTGMSKRAIEKMPKDTPLRRSWGGSDSLRIIITVVIPYLKLVLEDVWNREDVSIDSYQLVVKIGNMDFQKMMNDNKHQISFDFLPDNSMALLRFSWSSLSLGWYLSLLLSDIYHSLHHYSVYSGNNNRLMRNLSESMASVSKFTSSWTNFLQLPVTTSSEASSQTIEWVAKSISKCNVYADTAIRLFKVEATNSESFFNFNRLTSVTASSPGAHGDIPPQLARRVSEIRLQNASRGPTSISSNGYDDQEHVGRNTYRNSVTSLHSLNTLNRTRSNTPRNSISN